MKRSVWLVLGLLAVLFAGAWYGRRLVRDHAIAANHLPPVPTLVERPAVFADSLTAAQARTHSWLHARQGLAELSQLYHANGCYPEALACYEGLSRMEPGNARWPHLQASIAANSGRLDEALPLREKVVGLAPDYTPARLRLGDVLLKINRVADAVRVYADVLHRAPDEPYALLGLARCDLAANDWTKASEHLQSAIARHPDFVGALSLLVTVSEHFGDLAAAESYKNAMSARVFTDLPDPWLDQLSDVCFDAYLLSVAASTANFAGNRPSALDLINRAIALAPDISTYRRQAGQYLLQDNNFGAAKFQLEKAVEVNPTDSDSWLRYLDALRGLHQSQAFLAALLNGLSHCPQSSGLHLEYARWLKSANRMDEAIAEFRYGYQLRPSEASPLVELATTYLTVGRTSEAVDSLNLALERQPDHPSALATLAFIAISNNNEAEARRRLAQIRQQGKAPPELISTLNQAFQQQFGRNSK
jgi:tetratricopeptide (TPR) repeat protein